MIKKQKNKKGFTLIELLIVIAIIGILAGVVLVSTNGAVTKARRSSALTTAASVMPELVTCQDDGGTVAAPVIDDVICAGAAGHTAVWPNINANTGWQYAAGVGSLDDGDFTFIMTKNLETQIACDMETNSCCDDADGDKEC